MRAVEIRERYPNPVTSIENPDNLSEHEYCVGGAFILYSNINGVRFPNSGCLANSLRQENSRLTFQSSIDFSMEIIATNDEGRFLKAWRTVQRALDYGQKRDTIEQELE